MGAMETRPFHLPEHSAAGGYGLEQVRMSLVLVAFAMGVILLFSVSANLVLNAAFGAPPASVLNSSFTADADGRALYAQWTGTTIARMRAAITRPEAQP
jgi:hypothetical protein